MLALICASALSLFASCGDEALPSVPEDSGEANPPRDAEAQPDGGFIGPDSGIVIPDGSTIGPDGEVIGPDGEVIGGNDSGIIIPDGSTIGPDGEVIGPDGEVIGGNDSGTPAIDSGTPAIDSGTPAPDSGTPRHDAGAGFPDAGPNPNNPASDVDCDGLSDADELTFGTSPTRADSDQDGLSDGLEVGRTTGVTGSGCPAFSGDQDPTTTTNPLAPDSDGDGVWDGAEDLDHNGAVSTNELDPNTRDTDADGLEDGVEDRNGNGVRDSWETSGTLADTDLDGIADGVEDLDHNGRLDSGESNPIFIDTDFDGLNDGIEDANHNGIWDAGETSATIYDSDLDGLTDGCEDANHNGVRDPGESDPREFDSDLDGLDDGDEDANSNCVVDSGETDPSNSDTDCDALSDFTEIATTYATGLRSDPLNADSDGDLLTDGLEAGAAAAVPLSNCASVNLDVQPSSRTNPTLADTDNDGRSDGCEDRNHNGRREGGELDPNSADTDGDGLLDAQEDTSGNCARNGSETSATSADTDNDGIGDAIEIATGTDPTNADSDNDGIPDGVEDANQNGVVEPNETNPTLTDTDGDGRADGLEDANHNGTVDSGETDPRDADTDNDGLTDGEEATRGTNPLDNDSDNDGLLDGDEIARGTDPLDSDSDNDGLLDGDEVTAGTDPLNALDPNPTVSSGINTICSSSGLKVVQFQNHAASNTQVALETAMTYAAITVTAGDSAAVFGDNTLGVTGFVINTSAPVAGTNPTTEAQAIIARLTAGSTVLGATAINVQNNGRQITTHDSFGAVVDIRANLTLSANARPTAMRDRVMAVLSGHAIADFSGLPAAGGANATNYVVRFESLVRTSPTRVVLIGAVTSDANFNNATTQHRAQLEDLSNGTALAQAYATNATGCDPFTATATPRADFIWMADVSASTDNDRGTIATAAGTIFTALTNNGVDFRMGVVPHFENRRAQGSAANAGDLRSGFTRDRNTFIADLNNTAGTDGCEFGLTAADDALAKALPRTAAGPANELSNKLRGDAQLVVFYISDEHAQETENNQCGLGALGTGLRDIFAGGHEQTNPTAAQQTAIDTIVAPFVTNIRNNDGIAFAQLHPLQAPFCFVDFPTDEEEGYGYFEAVTALGGTFYRVCDSNPGATLTDIINAVSGAASQYVLQQTPISATIKVGLTRANQTTTTVVPRSSTDGFDYDPAANTIFFHGATYRPLVGDQVTISYRIFGTPTPPVTCAPPLVLNTVTNSCECPADCGVLGGCTGGRLCDRNTAVCACVCEPDCNGLCRASEDCNVNTCACECAPNCGGTCTNNQVCNQSSCSCSCPSDCGGACTNNQVCNTASCACECPANCGGCPTGQTCNVATCACEGGPL